MLDVGHSRAPVRRAILCGNARMIFDGFVKIPLAALRAISQNVTYAGCSCVYKIRFPWPWRDIVVFVRSLCTGLWI